MTCCRNLHRRQRRCNLIGLIVLIVTLVVALLALVYCRLHSTLELASSLALSETAQLAEMRSLPIDQIITTELPTKLAEANDKLQINQVAKLADGNVPAGTATAIALIDLSDGSQVNYHADQQFTSASTYKLLVAYAMIHDVETGIRNWNSSLNGTTWDNCLAQTIVQSDNACPEAYLNLVGFDTLTKLAHNLGLSGKTEFALADIRTTAADLALFLNKLYDGELMSPENEDKLLALMAEQVYRWGIPAGVGDDTVVYNKVGWLDSLIHDAAIVSTPNKDYILVIMTNGESREYVAEISRYIYQVMTNY